MTRRVVVPGERLARWLENFQTRHGAVTTRWDDGALHATAGDGAAAVLAPPFPAGPPDAGVDPVEHLAAQAGGQRRVAVLLVRRGGFACAVVDGDRVESSKLGRRYVQSRTAAGGWSQQRFARRRDNQAEALVRDAADVAVAVLAPAGAGWLATGGDRSLAERVLGDPRLSPLARLPRGPHVEVGDPRIDDVRALPARLRSLDVTVVDP